MEVNSLSELSYGAIAILVIGVSIGVGDFAYTVYCKYKGGHK